ncbi:MAG TPA: TMEM43 family protein [Geminicoccaceae bacterium]|nr:TMEM43 family protein [Geminicoccus sp.]HMU52448.1 TMEM43 family protein [Geminicoccaceae bacterium]
MHGGRLRAILGTLALLAGIAGLLFNEWRIGRLDRGMADLRALTVDADPMAADLPSDRPLRLSGRATSATVLVDPVLPVRAQALRLDRVAEMFQHEVRDGVLVDRTMRPKRIWSERLMDSSRFANRSPINPGHMPITSLRQRAEDARLGRLVLPAEAINALPASLSVTPERPGPVTIDGTTFQRTGDGYQSGDSRASPAIGDVRIRIAAVPAGQITVIGGVSDGRIVPWRTAGDLPLLLAAEGGPSVVQMTRSAAQAAAPGLWQGRLGGGAVSLFGLLVLWPRRSVPAPRLVTLCGRHPIGGPMVAALSMVAAVAALGWALFRNPLLWP